MTRRSHLGHKQKKYSRSYFQPAFGLVEVVLAMFILTTALMVVMLPAIKTIQYTKQNRQVVLAANLAQEGVEILRNIRDSQFAHHDILDATLDNAFGMDASNTTKVCSIDYKAVLSNCKDSGFIKIDGALVVNSDKFYEKNPGSTDAVFWRRAVIRRVTGGSSNVRYQVTVQVVWGNGVFRGNLANCTRSNQCVFAEAIFTNWNYWSEQYP